MLCPETELDIGGTQLLVTFLLLCDAPHPDTVAQLPPGVAGSDVR